MAPSVHPAAPRDALAANTPTGTHGPTGAGAYARSDAGAGALRLRHMHLVEGVPKK